MSAIVLPEPSGEVVYHDLQNSYGERGCFKVGTAEIENPVEDVKWAAQFLADAMAALAFENASKIDALAAMARDTYYGTGDDLAGWDKVDESYKSRWRAVIRAVLDAP